MSLLGKKRSAASMLVKKRTPAHAANSAATATPAPAALAEHSVSAWHVSINDVHLSADALDAYATKFQSGTPFPHLHVPNVFPDVLLQQVRREMLDGVYFRKRNDLYDFLQTDDLKRAKGNATAALREYIYSPAFRSWITRITGVETNDTIDLSAAQYRDGSVLLCHDDDLSERRIAYIVYLVPEDWTEEDGGTLDLFNTIGDSVTPGVVTRRLVPAWNSIAFFEVSALSHHQVAEVLNDLKGPRMSISGWFHGKPVARPPLPPLPPIRYIPCRAPVAALTDAVPVAGSGASSNVALHDAAMDEAARWINPMYLRPAVLQQIRATFAEQESVELQQFLRPEVYACVMRAMGVQSWQRVGPPNFASYKKAWDTASDDASTIAGDVETLTSAAVGAAWSGILPDDVHQLYRFLTGHAFMLFVQAVAAHGFASLGDDASTLSNVTGQVRCFAHGDYTLLCDPEYKATTRAAKEAKLGVPPTSLGGKKKARKSSGFARPATMLDATLCCVSTTSEWPESHGGYVSYLTSDEERLTVGVVGNSLSLVLRPPGVMSFVKFLTHHTTENRYDVSLSFAANPADEA